MPSPETPPRRRVLYIRHRRTVEMSDGFALNQDEWLDAMALLADVTLLDRDFDMDEACDRIQPDFILYESPFSKPAPLTISNGRAHPHIPRIGFFMQDPISPVRVNFLDTADKLNIRWIFTQLPEALLRQSPELKTRVYSISLLFDDTMFYDYGLEKDIPVSIMGGLMLPEVYNWRAEIGSTIATHFPTFFYTHPGYDKPVPRHKFPVSGAGFAKMLNRSHFSMADGTRFDYVVRKHLEIPAAGAVLIAPDAPALKPYGFKDMENCILSKGPELFEKMAAVADDPALYEKIRRAGHDLVHTKFSRRNWRGILDFYECLRRLQPGETIQQQGLLGPFEIVPDNDPNLPAINATYLDSDISTFFKGWMREILDENGPTSTAETFKKNPLWMLHMEEPFLLMGIIAFLQGEIGQARGLLEALQGLRAKQIKGTQYDPEELAWLSLIGALTGDAGLLKTVRKESVSMRHLSLRRMQWLGKILAAGGDASNPPPEVMQRLATDHCSIHWTGQMEIKQWLGVIGRILAANGQPGLLKF